MSESASEIEIARSLIVTARTDGPLASTPELRAQVTEVAEAESLPPELRSEALLALAVISQGSVSVRELAVLAERALALLGEGGEGRLRASGLGIAAAARAACGDLERSLDHCLQLRRDLRTRNITLDTRSRLNFGVALAELGIYEESASLLSAAMSEARTVDDQLTCGSGAMNVLQVLSRERLVTATKGGDQAARHEGLLEQVDAAIVWLLDRDGATAAWREFVTGLSAHAAQLRGDMALALTRWGSLDAFAIQTNSPLFTAYFCIVETPLAFERGDLDRAEVLIEEILSVSDEGPHLIPLRRYEGLLFRSRLHQQRDRLDLAVADAQAAAVEGTSRLRNLPSLVLGQLDRHLELERSRSELMARASQLETRALVDALSGAGNRQAFEEDVAGLRDASTDQRVVVVVLDIDNLKQINDEHGHSAGDAVIAKVGRVIADAIDPNDNVYRYGGDEFVVMSQDASGDRATSLVDRLRVALDRAAWPGDVAAGCSIGAAEGPAASVDELLAAADRQMYVAKRSA